MAAIDNVQISTRALRDLLGIFVTDRDIHGFLSCRKKDGAEVLLSVTKAEKIDQVLRLVSAEKTKISVLTEIIRDHEESQPQTVYLYDIGNSFPSTDKIKRAFFQAGVCSPFEGARMYADEELPFGRLVCAQFRESEIVGSTKYRWTAKFYMKHQYTHFREQKEQEEDGRKQVVRYYDMIEARFVLSIKCRDDNYLELRLPTASGPKHREGYWKELVKVLRAAGGGEMQLEPTVLEVARTGILNSMTENRELYRHGEVMMKDQMGGTTKVSPEAAEDSLEACPERARVVSVFTENPAASVQSVVYWKSPDKPEEEIRTQIGEPNNTNTVTFSASGTERKLEYVLDQILRFQG